MISWLAKKLGYKALAKEKFPGIGIYWLWQLPKSHPFYNAAIIHDQAYDLRKAGVNKDTTSFNADVDFYIACKKAAGDSKYYKAQALAFYYIVRAWGRVMWPKPTS